ncbi:solute carrier family 22 member 13-like [Ruditapes philippinarum]|uniref:solute carrier family 22 member 13-like n=1 Tax=Ruditapes philippinarum TaxID=129788 RepID=UPI00295B1491|nr:solute carrier family 22 member 13-like [Ruditapes philippinarum]
MSSYSVQTENLIEELGGCGHLQVLLCLCIHSSNTIIFWSILAMSFFGYTPDFSCTQLDVSKSSLSTLNLSNVSPDHLCSAGPNTTCSSYIFQQSMNTIVKEWNLICDRRWIVALITSLQMVGYLVGSIIAGLMADSLGRKATIMSGIASLTFVSFVGFFAQSWKMYAAIRFFIGIGAGLSYTVQFTYMIEFVPTKWRPLVVCFPSEPIAAMLLAFVSWWLHDWRSLHLLKTIVGVLFFIMIWFFPESFRWLGAKMKLKRAKKSIEFIAKVNRRKYPDLEEVFNRAKVEAVSNITINSNFTNLLTSKELRNVTLPLSIVGFSACLSWYCLSLGMEVVSVNVYLTILLMNFVDFPADLMTAVFISRTD